ALHGRRCATAWVRGGSGFEDGRERATQLGQGVAHLVRYRLDRDLHRLRDLLVRQAMHPGEQEDLAATRGKGCHRGAEERLHLLLAQCLRGGGGGVRLGRDQRTVERVDPHLAPAATV